MTDDAQVTFDGETVEAFTVKFRQYTGPVDKVLALDEVVQVKIVAHVSNVDHGVNGKTGVLERVHLIKILDVEVITDDQDS